MANIDTQLAITKLHVRDLVSVTANCLGSDPGPDPTWYPDEWPTESDMRTSKTDARGMGPRDVLSLASLPMSGCPSQPCSCNHPASNTAA
jgi:hypothetical protein